MARVVGAPGARYWGKIGASACFAVAGRVISGWAIVALGGCTVKTALSAVAVETKTRCNTSPGAVGNPTGSREAVRACLTGISVRGVASAVGRVGFVERALPVIAAVESDVFACMLARVIDFDVSGVASPVARVGGPAVGRCVREGDCDGVGICQVRVLGNAGVAAEYGFCVDA